MEKLTKIDGVGQAELKRCFGCGPEKAGENNENCGMCEDWNEALTRLHELAGKPKSIIAQLQHVVDQMCDGYCKYPKLYSTEADEEQLNDICDSCPLNNLI